MIAEDQTPPLSFEISDREFNAIRKLIYQHAGISMSEEKRSLIVGRLSKRLRAYRFEGFSEYLELIGSESGQDELRMTIDLLTTNETYFFRERKHFDFLTDLAQKRKVQYGDPFRVWSAASSSGEEAYTIAMFLEEALAGGAYKVLGTDISTRVLKVAERGHYSMERIRDLPRALLHKYCLRGVGRQDGTVLVSPTIRKHVSFRHLNLHDAWPGLEKFDVIFLRNVMIYFDSNTKKKLISRIVNQLKPDGYLVIGHSETLNGVSSGVRSVMPSVYQKAS